MSEKRRWHKKSALHGGGVRRLPAGPFLLQGKLKTGRYRYESCARMALYSGACGWLGKKQVPRANFAFGMTF
jgi:hypothetical protein